MTEDSEKRREIEHEISANKFNPMNDALCKFIFGREERKSILIDFLNAVLEGSLGHSIADIRYIPTEQIPLTNTGRDRNFFCKLRRL